MKKILPSRLCLLALFPLFSAFIPVTRSFAQDNTTLNKTADLPKTCFVEMNDGTIKRYSSLKLVTGIMMSPHLVADGQYIINGNEIKSYQDNERYAISQKTFASGRRSYLALETLPGFVVRISSGKINLYNKKYFNGFRKVNEFYVQSGNDGPILPYSAALMNELVKDQPEASSFFNSSQNALPLQKKLQGTADIINNASLVSKNL